jgi:hypothetical protein
MAKFNTKPTAATRHARVTSPVASTHTVGVRTHEGHPGYRRDNRSELFLLGISNFVGENTFYESVADRDARFLSLVQQAAIADIEWLSGFARWLRVGANMRSASLQLAAEAVKARLQGGLSGGNRQLIDSVLQRPDEPGEFLAYWASRYGNDFPKPVRRGVGDAVRRMYSERSYIKYDSERSDWRFGDVVAMARPRPKNEWQDALFEYALADRHNRVEAIPQPLGMLQTRQELLELPMQERRAVLATPDRLNAAGFTWESLSGWLQGPMDAQAWESVIPSMGVMALLRNLRNFDLAQISNAAADVVIAKITDPEQVERSRILPMRVLSAYNHAPSDRWKHYLSITLDLATDNIPRLNGQTLILVDTSSSMHAGFSKDGSLMRWDAATLFGLVLAKRNEGRAEVISFSSYTKEFRLHRGANVLNELQRWQSEGYFMGGGTNTAEAVRAHYSGQDRIVILTDEQAHYGYGATVDQAAPAAVPMYTWNLAGYEFGHTPSGTANRHTFGGLSDQAFSTIPMVEALQDGRWPWEDASD